ncbi:poly(beta-D-mannuronate) lyase [Catalinimonas alkaloidigena]|uniref:polysaccharide lyase 6 family protein n=1 Tax=Catalinimonas alkaloidigena TaxID=1075417 RepID=UPI002404B10F|nr:polysaccharide lyase 6 family protein [Catalinimonas alkaloidigena]MDF9799273.1 poly(beta-D-mannuronate) lyase [Catalinimonas alkaloidigena]
MIKHRTTYLLIIILVSSLLNSCKSTGPSLVKDEEELEKAIADARPGSTITLANGIWKDTEIEFVGEGKKDSLITLKAEEAGKVFIEGQSNLSLSGNYLEVSGLVFRNGYSPTNSVIAFRTSEDKLANHSRVTNCVIDNFSKPERFESDIWVTMYGKNNRFDHNSLIGKRNLGVTMAVRLNTEASRENSHLIEYNYFGPRQNMAANGGETLRIGTSHYSLTDSKTTVSNNYFDRCDGEHEIISNKSGRNVFKNNVFDQCRGTLTMRHGQHTLVENNYFLGRRKPNTGGIRVINEYQKVINNYMSGLTGYRFRGALVIMNGVPNSPINRYNQVVDSKVEGNIMIDCDHVQLCAGSDEERSAVPVGTTFTNNIILSKTNTEPFTVYDEISGITFSQNLINREAKPPLQNGFKPVDYQVEETAQGLIVPSKNLLEQIGFTEPKLPVQKSETGADYYAQEFKEPAFRTGKRIKVPSGTNTLLEALEKSESGDVLVLESAGEYLLTKDFPIHHLITIQADACDKPVIRSEKNTFFRIENEGGLELVNLKLDGSKSPDMAGNSVVSTSKYSMNRNYKLFVRSCEVSDLDVNHTFDFLKIYPSTMADTVLIENSSFRNVSGSIVSMAEEVDDLGMYNVEHVIIKDSHFNQVEGSVANVYRGGTDESTFGPIVSITNSKFTEVGKGPRNKTEASLKFHGVQNLMISDSQWQSSAPLTLYLTNGEPITQIENITLANSGNIVSNSPEYSKSEVKIISQ